MYSQPDVAEVISEQLIPVRVHVKEQAEEFQRLGAQFDAEWTPTTLIVDSNSKERHRMEGFLPKDDFVSQIELGLAKTAFSATRFDEAAQLFEAVRRTYPDTDAAPEAQYWAGVARYKSSGDAKHLGETTDRFRERYADSTWAKKASVWGRNG